MSETDDRTAMTAPTPEQNGYYEQPEPPIVDQAHEAWRLYVSGRITEETAVKRIVWAVRNVEVQR